MTDDAPKPTLAEIIAKLKAIIAECEENPDRIPVYFGSFETSEGKL